MIRAYFFDWMGTLGNCNKPKLNGIYLTEEEHYSLLQNPFKEVNLSSERRESIKKLLEDAHHELYQDSQKIIETLISKYKLAIVSNMYEITAKKIRELFPRFLKNFDIITLSAEVGLKKPDLEIFTYTLKELNKLDGSYILPQEVIMIGDEKNKDYYPAFDLGMQARLIDRTKQKLEDVI